jgi:hypothetical protein
VERVLLVRENISQTCRLLLLDAFKADEPKLTAMFHEIHHHCPSLFDTILPRSELEDFRELREAEKDVSEVSIEPDDGHKRPSAIGAIEAQTISLTYGFPTRMSKQVPEDFRDALRTAFELDYNMKFIVSFENHAIHWCTKLAFYDPITERRTVLKVGDFVEAKGRLGRIDHLFVQTLLHKRRLFANVTWLEEEVTGRDQVLDLPIFHFEKKQGRFSFVGLPSILAKKVYMVPTKEGVEEGERLLAREPKEAKDLIHVTWTLQYL